LQALSHTGFFRPRLLAKTDRIFACCYPEPDGEFLNQSKTIISALQRTGNRSEGHRTTEVILVSR